MAQVKNGDTVSIHFVGKLEDGTIIESTRPLEEDANDCGCGEGECLEESDCGEDCGCGGEEGPYRFTLGADDFLGAIEDAMIGMSPAEKKTIVLRPVDAFGEVDDDQIFTVDRSEMPEDLNPEVGMTIEYADDNDEWYLATILDLTDESVTLDTNHPLAGQTITYEIELLEIH